MELGLIKLARSCNSLEELAEKLGWNQDLDSFTEYIDEKVAGISFVVRRNQALMAAREAQAAGDEHGMKRYRSEALRLTSEAYDAGLVDLPTESKVFHKPQVKTQVKAIGRRRKVLHPSIVIPPGAASGAPVVACSAMRSEVLGYTGGTYGGRSLIAVRIRSSAKGGPFGRIGRSVTVARTIHNGMINHADLEQVPTPFWVVQDQFAEQAGPGLKNVFTKSSIIEAAVKICGKGSQARCTNAFNILKTHQDHRSKASQCYSYIIDNCEERGSMVLRPRSPTETYQFFAGLREQIRRVRSGEAEALISSVRHSAEGSEVVEAVDQRLGLAPDLKVVKPWAEGRLK